MAMREDVLKIGYAGTLMSYTPGSEKRSKWAAIKDWFWTYQIPTANQYTRSGYFLIRGVERFKAKYPELAGRLQVELWGMVDGGNKRQAKEFGVDDIVDVQGYFKKTESMTKIAGCDVLFLPLETGDDPLYIPGKIFDYIRKGKPVFIMGHRSDCTDILERAGLGILVDPFDAEAVADTLKELVEGKKELGTRYTVDWEYVEKNFHFKNLTKQLIDVFEGLE
ncbi:MAG: hypothetical protein AAF570_14595 [Bacteroidota bacterium]